jgi:hypothetical protein
MPPRPLLKERLSSENSRFNFEASFGEMVHGYDVRGNPILRRTSFLTGGFETLVDLYSLLPRILDPLNRGIPLFGD